METGFQRWWYEVDDDDDQDDDDDYVKKSWKLIDGNGIISMIPDIWPPDGELERRMVLSEQRWTPF